jgi:histone H2A
MSTETKQKKKTASSKPTKGKKGDTDKPEKLSQSKRAGLVLPVGRISRQLKRNKYSKRIGRGAPVAVTAIVENLIAEILELAGHVTKRDGKVRVVPKHINIAIRNDEELDRLFKHVSIFSGGVMPSLLLALDKKKRAKAPEAETEKGTKKKQKEKKKAK